MVPMPRSVATADGPVYNGMPVVSDAFDQRPQYPGDGASCGTWQSRSPGGG